MFALLFRLLNRAQKATGQPPILGTIHRVHYYKRAQADVEHLLDEAVNAYKDTLEDPRQD